MNEATLKAPSPRERVPVTVRPATATDLESIVLFNAALAWETEAKRLDLAVLSAGVARALNSPALGRYFVAEVDGQVVGQTMLTYELTDWRDGVIYWIQSVYIRAEFRRHGIFRRLYAEIKDLAGRDPAARGLRLYVEHENTAALLTYERLGMQRSPFYFYDADL